MMKKLFAFIFGLLPLQTYSQTPTMSEFPYMIRVVVSCSEDTNKITQYPHRDINSYSDAAIAYWDSGLGELCICFNMEAEEVTISIYKDGILVTESIRPTAIGDEACFDLSSYGNGEYQIVISGIGDNDLHGNFSQY